jgi:hypothetical protein
LTNPGFRALLLDDPQAAARQLRYRLDDSQVERIRRVNAKAADALAADLVEAVPPPYGGNIGFW